MGVPVVVVVPVLVVFVGIGVFVCFIPSLPVLLLVVRVVVVTSSLLRMGVFVTTPVVVVVIVSSTAVDSLPEVNVELLLPVFVLLFAVVTAAAAAVVGKMVGIVREWCVDLRFWGLHQYDTQRMYESGRSTGGLTATAFVHTNNDLSTQSVCYDCF